MKRVLAFDFGGSSGRAILGEYRDGKLDCREVHRFDNTPRQADGYFRWDFADLMANVHAGIKKAGSVDSISFDIWGVDFGLLDRDGNLLEDPVHYRDDRTAGMVEQALQAMPADALYAATGSQIMPINTLFQLLAVKHRQPELWAKASRLLFMPDLFAHALCGADACETTIASTSQLLDVGAGTWSKTVLRAFDIPETLFAPLVASGTVVGEYRGAKVIAGAGHDTQCAVTALPAPEADAAFLSCGTWSLLGCELDAPLLNAQSRRMELSNERGGQRQGQLPQKYHRSLADPGEPPPVGQGRDGLLLCRAGTSGPGRRAAAQLHRPRCPRVHPARRHPRPRAGILPPYRPAGAEDGGPGHALHL